MRDQFSIARLRQNFDIASYMMVFMAVPKLISFNALNSTIHSENGTILGRIEDEYIVML